MMWPDLWMHFDGLVHIIARHLERNDQFGYYKRVVYAECDLEIAGLDTRLETMPAFLRSNTKAKYPTCIACWDSSNFGTYRPR